MTVLPWAAPRRPVVGIDAHRQPVATKRLREPGLHRAAIGARARMPRAARAITQCGVAFFIVAREPFVGSLRTDAESSAQFSTVGIGMKRKVHKLKTQAHGISGIPGHGVVSFEQTVSLEVL